ncbi:MAG: Lrp/AsnC family transcriptional regulator [Bacteroidia bacterium]|nr:Lrp/AsnC family transcriptional regulator [Bacteroidia bacterium]
MENKLDSINWDILSALQSNSRATFTEIGKQVGLTAPAVAERVKKMEDLGVLEGYRAKLSFAKLGYQLKAIITLRAFMGKLKPFLNMVSNYEEVINCYRITGNENIVMEVVLRDQMHLEKFIDKLIRYGETRTHIVLSDIVADAPIKPNKLKET